MFEGGFIYVGPGVVAGAVKFDLHPALGFKSGDEFF